MASSDKSLTVTVRLETPAESVPPLGKEPSEDATSVPIDTHEIAALRKRYAAEEKACRKYLDEHWKGNDLAKGRIVTPATPVKVVKDYERRQRDLVLAVAAAKWCDRMERLLQRLEKNGRLHVRAYGTRQEYGAKRQVELLSTKGFPVRAGGA